MNFKKVLRGIRVFPSPPPMYAWKRLQTRSLKGSAGVWGQRNLVKGTTVCFAACRENSFLYRSICCMTDATGNLSRRDAIVDGSVVPTCQAKALNVSGGQVSSADGETGTAGLEVEIETK